MKEEIASLLLNNPIVKASFEQAAGNYVLGLETALCAMDAQAKELSDLVVKYDSVRPRRYRDAEGQVWRWDAPDEFVALEFNSLSSGPSL